MASDSGRVVNVKENCHWKARLSEIKFLQWRNESCSESNQRNYYRTDHWVLFSFYCLRVDFHQSWRWELEENIFIVIYGCKSFSHKTENENFRTFLCLSAINFPPVRPSNFLHQDYGTIKLRSPFAFSALPISSLDLKGVISFCCFFPACLSWSGRGKQGKGNGKTSNESKRRSPKMSAIKTFYCPAFGDDFASFRWKSKLQGILRILRLFYLLFFFQFYNNFSAIVYCINCFTFDQISFIGSPFKIFSLLLSKMRRGCQYRLVSVLWYKNNNEKNERRLLLCCIIVCW